MSSIVSPRQFIAGLAVLSALALTACSPTANQPSAGSGDRYVNPKPAERVKPNPGKGNVQGQVFYNSKPVENIEVKLCEKFDRMISSLGCRGKTHKASTDREGYFVLTDIEPGKYQGLLVRVFNTESYIVATKGIGGLDNVEHDVAANQTLFVDPKHLFKTDLKPVNPESGERVKGQKPELKWQAYPDATSYKVSLYPKDIKAQGLYNQVVKTNILIPDKPLSKGEYTWKIEAYNGEDKKLSESEDGIKFIVD